jgi:hypothetical protein
MASYLCRSQAGKFDARDSEIAEISQRLGKTRRDQGALMANSPDKPAITR